MISIKAEITARGVLLTDPQALGIYQEEVIRGGVEATEMALTAVVATTPVGQTGLLWKAWFKKAPFGAALHSLIANPLSYGEIVEKGSRAHVIAPRHKKALAFLPGGGTFAERFGSKGTVIVRKVKHPGTKGRRFVEKTTQRLAGLGAWNNLWERVVNRIVERLS